MAELQHAELSGRMIEAAIAVHTAVGPGFLESVYENALCVELRSRGIRFEQQKVVRILHRGEPVGEHRLDVVVEGMLLGARSEMRAAGISAGLVLNFASAPLTIKRVGPGKNAAS